MKKKLALLLLAAVLLSGCGSNTSSAAKWKPDLEPMQEAATPEPTEAPEPTTTPEPESTPEPEALPTEDVPETPAPAPVEPVVYMGSGDDVLEIELLEGGCAFHVTGNQADRYFGVIGYDGSGKRIEAFVNTSDPYDGITYDPDQKTALLEIEATGEWAIELVPLAMLETISTGETITGEGDCVIRILESGATATISGNDTEVYFGVRSYAGSKREGLVNTTDKYDGTVMLKGSPDILVIEAEGAWSVTFN